MPVELTDDLNGEVSARPEGQMGYVLKFKNGQLHGRQQFFNRHGKPFAEIDYVDGKKHGHFYFKKPGGEVVVDEEFVDGMPKKADEEKADKPKKDGLAGLFGALLGAISKEFVAAEMAEDMLKPTNKLFFHKQDKVFALFEKMQSRVLGEA